MIYEQLLAFCGVFLFRYAWLRRVDNTILILVAASYCNLIVNSFMGPEDPFLVPIYSSIDALTIIFLIKHGDILKGYQSALLTVAVFIHLALLIDVNYKLNIIYDDYETVLGMVTIFQLIGGLVHGVAKRERPSGHGSNQRDIHYFSINHLAWIRCKTHKTR